MTRDQGGARGKEEPAEAVGVERQIAAEGLQGTGRVTNDQGGAGRMKEIGEAVRPRVSGGA